MPADRSRDMLMMVIGVAILRVGGRDERSRRVIYKEIVAPAFQHSSREWRSSTLADSRRSRVTSHAPLKYLGRRSSADAPWIVKNLLLHSRIPFHKTGSLLARSPRFCILMCAVCGCAACFCAL